MSEITLGKANERILDQYNDMLRDGMSDEVLIKSIGSIAIYFMDEMGVENITLDGKTLTLNSPD